MPEMPPRFTPRKGQGTKVAAVNETSEVCFRGLPPQLTDLQLMHFLRPKIGVNAIGVSKRTAQGEVFLKVPQPAVPTVIQTLDGLMEVEGISLSAPLRVTATDDSDGSPKFGPSLSLRDHKSATPCTFWQKGHCPRGGDCRFSHTGNPGERQTCYAFQKGTCPHGVACRFSHDSGFEHKGSSPGPKITIPCNLFQKGVCPNGDSCRFVHDAGGQQVRKKGETVHPCFNFVNGTCANGDTCNYSHDPEVTGGPRPCFNFQKGQCTRGSDCGYSHARNMPCFAFGKGNCSRGDDCEFSHTASGPRPCFNFQRGICTRGEDCHFSHGFQKKQIKLSREVELEIKLLARRLLNSIGGKMFAHLPENAEEEFQLKQENDDIVRRQIEMHKQRLRNFDPLLPSPGPSSFDSTDQVRRIGFKTTTLPAITMDSKKGFLTHEFSKGRDVPLIKPEGGFSSQQGHFGDVGDEKNHWGGVNGFDREKNSERSHRSNDRKDYDRPYNNADQSRNPYSYQEDKNEGDSYRDKGDHYREKRPRTEESDSRSYSRSRDERDEKQRDYSFRDDKRARTDDGDSSHRYHDKRDDDRYQESYEKHSRNDEMNGKNYYDRRSRSRDVENNSYLVKEERERESGSKRGDDDVPRRNSSSRDESRENETKSTNGGINAIQPYTTENLYQLPFPPATPKQIPAPELDAPPGMSRVMPAVSVARRSSQDVSHWLTSAEDDLERGLDPFEAVSQVASNLGLSDKPGAVNHVVELLVHGDVTSSILDRYLKVLERVTSQMQLVEIRSSDGSVDRVRAESLAKILMDALRSSKQKKLINLTNNLKTHGATDRSPRKRSSSPRKRSSSPRRSDRRRSSSSRRDRGDKRRSSSPREHERERHRDRNGHKKEKREKPSRSTEKRRRSRSSS